MTEELDNRLHEALAGGQPAAARSEEIKKEALRMFDHKMTIIKIWAWVGIAVSCVFMLGGVVIVALAGNNIQGQVGGALLFATGLSLEVLMKLWFWIVHSRLSIQKDLAEIRAQLAEHIEQTGKTSS
jgi:hypothetical protein